ncbi:hypothetical protein ACROYT_G026336 [Oculina patagonica]
MRRLNYNPSWIYQCEDMQPQNPRHFRRSEDSDGKFFLAKSEREHGDRDRRDEPDRTEGDWRSKPDPIPDQNGYNDRDRYNDDSGPRDRWGQRGGYDSGPRDRSGYRGYDDGPPRDRPGYGRDRGYDDGPRGRDYGPPDRRGDDRFGDRDRGKGFGSGWDSGDRDRQDDRGYDRSDGGYGRDRSGYGRDRPGDRYGGDRDRAGGFGRDRYDDRRSGDRYGGDRFGGDRYGGDRYGGDRDRGGGFGRDRYDDRRYGDRDRYDDRRGGGDRYGDRDRRRDYDDRDRERDSWRDSDRGRDARSDFDRDEREPVKERPKLQLQPRTKPVEEKKDEPVTGSSVFGGAKPVDTAAKEREIEEKLARQKLEDEAKLKQEKERRERRERDEWPRGVSGRARRDSNRSSDGERGPKERRDSNRRDSARSSDEGTPSKDSETPPRESPRGGAGKEAKEAPKEPPKEAPPPAVNVWAKRMEQQKAASTGAANADKSEPKSPTGELRVEINVDSSSMTVTKSPTTPTSPDRKGFGKPGGPKKEFRDSREGGGPPRGRGRGTRPDRGDRSERPSGDQDRGGGRGVKKEKRERKPAEPKKYEEAKEPVFHTASKFSALLDDEEAEQDAEQQHDEENET